MPFVAYSQDYMLQQWGSNHGLYMSAHSAYSASGADELSGGSYARVPITWGTPASGIMALSGTPYTINAPASSTIGFLGFWDAASGGNFQGMTPNGAQSAYAFAAPQSTGVLLAPGSGYTANTPVCVFATGGSSLPGGLVAGTVYYVKSPSSDSFSLAATSGGAAITLTSDGSGYVMGIITESFGSAGTLSVASGSMTLV